MVGNNLARDVRGANAAGLRSVWLRFNTRYPTAPADEAERPSHAVASYAELRALVRAIG
jgi:putative hydrolase of the HAD superfamily